jgi:phage terminase large subunit
MLITQVPIPYNWQARPYQLPMLEYMRQGLLSDRGKQRAVCVWHRRAGKDLTALNWSVYASIERPAVYYHMLPKLSQGRKVVWDGKDREGRAFMDYWPPALLDGDPNQAEMKIKTKSGSLWQILGSDNYDSVMGTNPAGIVFSEFSLQDPRAWDYFRPILMENKGWALFLYTPRGRNHAYDLYLQAQANPLWHCELLTVKDTNVVSQEDIQEERQAGMSDEMIDQEFYCSFDASAPGAYYAKELRLAREQGRITSVPFRSGIAVDTWWDLGWDDSTSIWFTQNVGREIHLIAYYESRNEGFEHYAMILQRKIMEWGGVYGQHIAPHDITVHELGPGKTRLKTAGELGIKFRIAQRPARKEDGIQAVRNIFSICWFDEVACRLGIDGLSSYRSEFDEKNRVLRTTPVHDWASHPADAFQTLALAHKFTGMVEKIKVTGRQRPQAASGGWMVS